MKRLLVYIRKTNIKHTVIEKNTAHILFFMFLAYSGMVSKKDVQRYFWVKEGIFKS